LGLLTTKWKLFKPASVDPVDNVVDLNNNWDIVDAALGISIVTSTTRPTGAALVTGMAIYETDTKYSYVYDGAAWQHLGEQERHVKGRFNGATSGAGQITIATGLSAISSFICNTASNAAAGNITVNPTTITGGSVTCVIRVANTGATLNSTTVDLFWMADGTP